MTEPNPGEIYNEGYLVGYYARTQEVVEIAEEMKRKICGHGPSDSCDGACMHQHYDEEYNQALTDLITALSPVVKDDSK